MVPTRRAVSSQVVLRGFSAANRISEGLASQLRSKLHQLKLSTRVDRALWYEHRQRCAQWQQALVSELDMDCMLKSPEGAVLQHMMSILRERSFTTHTTVQVDADMMMALDMLLKSLSEQTCNANRWWALLHGEPGSMHWHCSEESLQERWWLDVAPEEMAEEILQCSLAEMVVDYLRGWTAFVDLNLTVSGRIFLVHFSSHHREFDEWLPQTPLWKLAVALGVDVQPSWANGGTVFAPDADADGWAMVADAGARDPHKHWLAEHLGSALGPQHVVLTSDQWALLAKLLKEACFREKPYPEWVMLVPERGHGAETDSDANSEATASPDSAGEDFELVTLAPREHQPKESSAGGSQREVRTACDGPALTEPQPPRSVGELGELLDCLSAHIQGDEADQGSSSPTRSEDSAASLWPELNIAPSIPCVPVFVGRYSRVLVPRSS